MRILYIASTRIPTEKASGLAIMRQCEAFAKKGELVTILRPARKNHIKEDPFAFYHIKKEFEVDTMKSLDFIQLGKIGFYINRFSQLAASLFYVTKHRNEIDVFYARDPWMLFLLLLFFSKKKFVWEAHQMQKGYVPRFVAAHVDLLVCISLGLKEYYVQFREDEITVEPSGVNVEQFECLPPVADIRTKLGIPTDKKVIGYIGKYTTMGEGKGVDELIEAFGGAYASNQNIHLLIVGLEESESVVVARKCKEHNIPEGARTLLPLNQKEFAHYVHATDILVMNYPDTEHYRKYMSPTKLFAFMAGKRHIIASDLDTVREIVNESMATIIPPDDPLALAKAIVKTTLEEFDISAAYEKVLTFTWENRAKRIKALI